MTTQTIETTVLDRVSELSARVDRLTDRVDQLSDRVSRVEGQIQYLATKADLERLRADLRADIMRMLLIAIGVNVAVVSAGIAFLRLTSTA